MNARCLSWFDWLWLAAVVFGFFVGSLGRLGADPVFEGDLLWMDASAAKVVSQIDLYAVGTNLWKSAKEERAGKFLVRAALDKARYQLGEPIHLFVYWLHHTPGLSRFPKAQNWQLIRPGVVETRGRPVPLTPIGEWQISYPNPFEWGGSRHLPTNTVKLNHIDLTELVTLDQPGEYFVFPHVIVNASFDGVDMREVPYLAELKPIRFEVTSKHFVRPATAPASVMVATYRQELRELDFRRWPQTDLEREVAGKGRQVRQARLDRHREFLESIARNAEATNVPAAPPRPVAPQLQVETAAPSRRPLRWPLLAAGAAVLAVLGWFWRRRCA